MKINSISKEKEDIENQMEILEIKNSIAKLKIWWMASTGEGREQMKESVNLEVN